MISHDEVTKAIWWWINKNYHRYFWFAEPEDVYQGMYESYLRYPPKGDKMTLNYMFINYKRRDLNAYNNSDWDKSEFIRTTASLEDIIEPNYTDDVLYNECFLAEIDVEIKLFCKHKFRNPRKAMVFYSLSVQGYTDTEISKMTKEKRRTIKYYTKAIQQYLEGALK
jgi:hypothetical protein